MCSAGNVRTETVNSLLRVVQLKAVACVQLITSGPFMDDARNNLVNQFFGYPGDAERILFVDSDVEFDEVHVRMLEDDDLPIVSGVYYSLLGGTQGPVAFRNVRVRPYKAP